MNLASPRTGLVHVGVILALASVPAVLAGVMHPRAPLWAAQVRPDDVTMTTVRGWAVQPLWIDARSATAFQTAHHPGAVPLHLSTWDEQIADVVAGWRPGQPVVVYCDSSTCQDSATVALRLRETYRLPDVWVLHGGWSAMQAATP